MPLRDRAYAPTAAALARIAVIPFYAHRSYDNARLYGGVQEDVARERVTDAIADAIAEQGIDVVSGDAVSAAIAGVQRLTPAVDARIFAEIADREFGATGILLGEVLRFSEAAGVSEAARRPASVAFQLALYEAPAGEKVWAARFDETQSIDEPDLVSAPDDIRPSVAWLSADEIARNGAMAAADALISSR
jgi:hypothetical protein